MTLERLWAGWRMPYVSSAAGASTEDSSGSSGGTAGEGQAGGQPVEEGEEARQEDCVFCRILASGEPDDVTNIVWRSRRWFAILNAFPYASGHLMVMPTRHVAELEDVTGQEAADLWAGLADAVRALKTAYRPDGVNVGANLGRAAGAGLPTHFHMHVVPRWVGDTNFTTAVAEIRVLPEALPDTWARLRAAWPAGPQP